MIRFIDVSYSYPGGKPVLRNINFSAEEGERIGLIGANGAGKSTLMKAALGLIEAEGIILIGGNAVKRDDLAKIRRIAGYVLQDPDNQMFMPRVIDDMVFGPVNYGMTRDEAEKGAEKILSELGISFLKDRYNHKISGGEKRMASIATVLMMDPKVIFMDEPSSSLDPKNRRMLINTLNGLKNTLVIASHDLDMILQTCSRVILIDKGEIAADGKAFDILRDRALLESHGLELPLSLQTV